MENTKKSKAKEIAKRAAGIFAVPVLVVTVIMIVCLSTGTMILSTKNAFYGFTRYAAVVFLTTIALSINLGSGRFDFSLGSIATLSSILAAKATFATLSGNAASGPMMLLLCLLFGAILGAASGGLYVLLKLPPIITSLGVTLIYEGLSFAVTGGVNIKSEIDNASMTFFRTGWWIHLLIMLVVLAVIYILFDRSKFGYNYRSLRAGQRISVNTGIKEIPNAIICYSICGGLMGIVGFLQALPGNYIATSVLNFGSIGIMFSAFLPMFIGGFIGRYSNDKIGYLIAAICMSLISSMFSLFNTIPIMASVQSVIIAGLLVGFLIFLNNEETCRSIVNGTFFATLQRRAAERKQAREAANGTPQE